MSRDTDENFHPVLPGGFQIAGAITEEDITQLKLAVDASDAHDRAECWKDIAVKLAGALHASGWTPASRGSEALDEFNCLLRIEERLKDKGRL